MTHSRDSRMWSSHSMKPKARLVLTVPDVRGRNPLLVEATYAA
jgi:hypothetical protein